MPLRLIKAGETAAAKRRLFWQIVSTDGISPATGEAGGQPQVSIDGAAWAGSGSVGVLTHVGNGRYYADLAAAAVATSGVEIESRYKSASTAECPGDSALVVAYDPYSDIASILSKLSLAGLRVSVSNPVDPSDLLVSVVAGDDYTVALGRPLEWPVEEGLDLTAAGVAVNLYVYDGPEGPSDDSPTAYSPLECTVTSAGGTDYVIKAEMLAAHTSLLSRSQRSHYRVVATKAGETLTEIIGEIEAQ